MTNTFWECGPCDEYEVVHGAQRLLENCVLEQQNIINARIDGFLDARWNVAFHS